MRGVGYARVNCTAFFDRPNGCFVPSNRTKLITRGGTSLDCVEMTLIRERKSAHRLGTSLAFTSTRSQLSLLDFWPPMDSR